MKRLGWFFAALCASCARREGEPENLLLVTLDCVRSDRFEEPARYSELPLALAHFAGEATRFTGFVASAPETLPAAAALMTGRHPRELGFPAPNRPLPDDVPTLAELLSSAGFDTAAFVAPRTLASATGIARGFALYSAPTDWRDEDAEVTERARAWLREDARRARPWFAWVHLNAAHGPYRVLSDSPFNPLNFFYKANLPPPDSDERRIPFAAGNSGRGGVPEYQRVGAPALFSVYRSHHDVRERVGDWFANELRHVLKLTGQYPDTVITVCGTHGEALGEGGVECDHGEDLHRATLETPLWLRVPGRAAGVAAESASHVDLLATLLGALGVPAPASSGRDLFAGGSGVAFSELYPPLGPRATAVAAGTRKLVRTEQGLASYDLALDPGEERGAPPLPGDELLLRLEAFERIPVRATPERALGARDLAELRDLGYVLARFSE